MASMKINPWLHGEPFGLLSDEDGMLHVVLAEGLDPKGYAVTAIRDDGIRVRASREGPGFFGIYGEAGGWWLTDRMEVAHIEVTDPEGAVTLLHHPSFPPGDCWMCGDAERNR